MKILKRTTWKTNRGYATPEKPILAWLVDFGGDAGTWTVFWDSGREIDGAFPWYRPSHLSTFGSDLEEATMFLYDRFLYTTWIDGVGSTFQLTQELLKEKTK